MTPTKRWLDPDSGSSSLERAVLGIGIKPQVPVGAREQGWQRLSVALAGSTVATLAAKPAAALVVETTVATGGKAAVSSIVSLGFLKGVLAGVVGCVLVQSGVGWLRSPAETGESVAPVASPTASHTRVTSSPPEPYADVPTPSVAPQPRKWGTNPVGPLGAVSAPSASANTPATADFSLDASGGANALAQEAALLRHARSALLAGNLGGALAVLEQSQRDVRNPQLLPEREALLIEVLYRSGRRAEGLGRAREYLMRFPDSPHAGKVRALLAEGR
jgi:hypothetical protein